MEGGNKKCIYCQSKKHDYVPSPLGLADQIIRVRRAAREARAGRVDIEYVKDRAKTLLNQLKNSAGLAAHSLPNLQAHPHKRARPGAGPDLSGIETGLALLTQAVRMNTESNISLPPWPDHVGGMEEEVEPPEEAEQMQIDAAKIAEQNKQLDKQLNPAFALDKDGNVVGGAAKDDEEEEEEVEVRGSLSPSPEI
ncbi:hypothetical protein GJ744_012037 [Endocarpon pusillum]|uniref:Uncharacterized protein n=1 Tax=Endocarpon pusillum TaxID=364733 RepID=A0A8H7E762_9EURO|nr:hypothetical protein GJ744_000850 [Endocarpon pusillum]KAF7512934.1 hypothetical protein GJ744_012037 [Endocarpon pusillum]